MNDLNLWTSHSLDKIFPDTLKPEDASECIDLKAAGNEREDAQIIIRTDNYLTLTKTAVSFTPLKGRNGQIDSKNLDAHWIWYTWVRENPANSPDKENWIRKAPDFFPDAFLETEEMTIAPDKTHPLWVRISIPKGTPAGIYQGEILIDFEYTDGDDQGGKIELPVKQSRMIVPLSCEVWPFSLPDDNTLHHTEWFHPDSLASYYNLEPWSEEHWSWIEKSAMDMAEHHQDMILTPYHKLVDVTISPEDPENTRYDFSRLDRWIKLFREAGIPWIEGNHLAQRASGWFSPFRFKRWEAIEKSFSDKLEDDQYIIYLEHFVKAVYSHLEQTVGLEKIVQHIADEPIPENLDSWKELSSLVRSWLPEGLPIIDATMSEELGDFIDMRVPQIQEINKDSRTAEKNLEKGLWSYVCLFPQGNHPNRFLDQDSIRNRILCWISFSLKLEGFLHWAYNFWDSWCDQPVEALNSPWTDATAGSVFVHKRQPLPPGDPFIVYPGRKSICSSIRWEVLRKGFEDHKLLTMLVEAADKDGGKSEAGRRCYEVIDSIRNSVASDSLNYLKDGAQLIKLRYEIGDLIAVLMEK